MSNYCKFVKKKIMIKLLKIELLKIRNYPVFWVIFGIIILLFTLTSIGAANLNFKFNIFYDSSGVDSKNYFMFPYVWSTFAWIAGWFSHFWAILLIILVGNEFNFRMFRQQHVYGLSRKYLLVSKSLVILVLPIIILILLTIFSIFFGMKYTENFQLADVFEKSFYVFSFYIQSVTYMTLAVLVVFLVNSTGLSIVVYFGFMFFEAIFRFLLKLKNLDGIIYFFPIKSISSLTPRPSIETAMSETLQQQVQISDNTSHFPILITIFIAVVYLAIFWGLSHLIIKKKDL